MATTSLVASKFRKQLSCVIVALGALGVTARAAPLQILQIRGLHFQYYRLDEAAKLLDAAPLKISFACHKATAGKRGVTYFPASLEELAQFDLVVMNDIPVAPRPSALLAADQLQLLRAYVAQGGALLVIGGHNAFAGGGYGQSVLADLLPVAVKERFDTEWLQPPARLNAPGQPVVMWRHQFAGVKPGAEVLLTAGNAPAIAVWPWQKGRVGVIGLTCYGVPPRGQTPFWGWAKWPDVLAQTIRKLTD